MRKSGRPNYSHSRVPVAVRTTHSETGEGSTYKEYKQRNLELVALETEILFESIEPSLRDVDSVEERKQVEKLVGGGDRRGLVPGAHK